MRYAYDPGVRVSLVIISKASYGRAVNAQKAEYLVMLD